MGSSHKTLLMHIASILSIMLYLMCLLIMPAHSATLSTHRRQTVESYSSTTALYHIYKAGHFYVEINVRNKRHNLIFDTGSTLSWVRCPDRWRRGDNDNRPEFIEWSNIRCPRGSPNFKCLYNGRTECYKRWCTYDYRYVDNTRTEGCLVWQEFGDVVNDKIVSGCSWHTNLGSSMLDGVLGMSRGSYSIIKQMSNQYSGMFSFCITHKLEMSFLNLGPKKEIPSGHKLKMLDGRVRHDWYDVHLVSMLVDSEEIVDPGMFNEGCVLNTGTRVSHLVLDAFDAIVELMDEALDPAKKIYRESQVCYDYTTEEWKNFQVPTIELRFKGVSNTVSMRWGAKQLFGRRNGAACLELLPSHDTLNTIGAFQMTDIHFAFDLKENLIYFKESPSCGED